MIKKCFALSCLFLLGSACIARADTITFTASGAASATITTGSNSLDVMLSSLQSNPTSASQEVSGIFITLGNLTGPLGSDSLSSSSGTLIDIAKGGAVTLDGGSITHWGTSVSASTICLETAGTCAAWGSPIDLIIGPAPYTNANPSITGRNPQIQDTGIFDLMISGITADTTITGVRFEFGTGPDSHLPGVPTPPPAVPEPGSLLLVCTGLLAAAAGVRSRFAR